MHIPKSFKITDKNEIVAFIKANAFGQLISQSGEKLFSTHIPFLLSDDKTKLLCHIGSENLQGQDIAGQTVLVTLQGAHDYISPVWYLGKGVPTWNYQAVHIYGRCHTFNDTNKLKTLVNTLTNTYEAKLPAPWQPEYNAEMLTAIIGIEITISEIQCQYKLSQNRPAQDRKQIIKQLNANGSKELAQAMKQSLCG